MNKAEFISQKLNKDFYDILPQSVCMALDAIIIEHCDKNWFIHAWNSYRDHVNSSTIDEMKSPGFIFNKYINDEDDLSHSMVFDSYTDDEIREIAGDDYFFLAHIGVGADDNPPGRGSGRYPKGSGKNPNQHLAIGDFYTNVNKLREQGLTDKEIYTGYGLNSTQFRALYTISKNNYRRQMVSYAKKASAEGKSNIQIGKELGEKFNEDKSPIGESTVRSLLDGEAEARMNASMKTAEQLKALVDEKGTLDVGVGVEKEIGITRTKMDVSIEMLKLQGYNVYNARIPQGTNPGQYTTVKVLARPDVENKEIYDWKEIGHLTDYTSPDDGDHILPRFQYPVSMDSKRLKVRFAEEGGSDKDGLVEIRRGVKDLSLGESNYAQVRILVDDDYYIKGMAVYGRDEDFPEGVDVIFNSNKSESKGKLGALKETKEHLDKDPNNPFGASIKQGIDYPGQRSGGQSYYLDDDGKYKLSLINKRSDEGDWEEWSKELPSQMLGKQPLKTIQRQLNLAEMSKEEEYNSILEIQNPVIKRYMLIEFADKCDKAAEELKAAPFPGQKYQVILPLKTIKDNECYAPNYPDGTEVALIRYPHGGTFEIPICKVNNRNKEGKDTITAGGLDAVGINAKTASQLSGADFDGDTVMVIPLQPDKFTIKSQDRLPGLIDFDPKVAYGPDSSTPIRVDKDGTEWYSRNGIEYSKISERYKQNQMGVVSNLITDMTLKGAPNSDIEKAVRHSMVIIDAEKHKLDYKQSEIDNDISALKRRYQYHVDKDGREHAGASTLLSRSTSEVNIPERKLGKFIAIDTGHELTEIDSDRKLYLDEQTGQVYSRSEKRTISIDPNTGKKLYRNTNNIYRDVVYKDSTGKKQKSRITEKDGILYFKDKETGEWKKVSTEKVITTEVKSKATQMELVDDAHELSSGKPQEIAYAEYANKMKSLANAARKESLSVKNIPYSPSAAKVYKEEVEDLDYQLNEAEKNAPRERQAQMIQASEMKALKQENPHMTTEEQTKLATRILNRARAELGASRKQISISDKQWEAIQAGAISSTKLEKIYKYADKSRLKQLATPYKNSNSLSKNQISRIKSLSSKGYTNNEIATLLGITDATVVKYLSGKE